MMQLFKLQTEQHLIVQVKNVIMQIVIIWVFRRHHHQAVALVKKVVRAVHQAAVLQKDYPMNHLLIVTWTGLVLVKTKKTNQTAHQSLVIQMEFVLATMKEEA